jgi:hypothetical protein
MVETLVTEVSRETVTLLNTETGRLIRINNRSKKQRAEKNAGINEFLAQLLLTVRENLVQ